MAEQDWLTPATASNVSPYQDVVPAPSNGAPAYDLRPLSLGELLDRTFSLYRSRFWLFAGIAAVSGATSLVVNVVQVLIQHFFWKHSTTAAASFGRGAISFVIIGIYFLAYSVTQAATIFAMAEVYLGKVATIGTSLRATAARWYVYAAIAIWQWWSLIWLPTVLLVPAMIAITMRITSLAILGGLLVFVAIFGGGIFGIISFLRNALAIQVTVEERLKIRASIRRSKDLSSGAKWRIFLVLIISLALYMVFGAMQLPLLYMVGIAAQKGGEAIGEQAVIFLIGFLGHTLVSPVTLIGWSLVYFDQRVRREAFDIAVLLGEPRADTLPAAPAAVYVAPEPVVEPYEARPYETSEPLPEPHESEARAADDPDV
jgi:hypothetical protein